MQWIDRCLGMLRRSSVPTDVIVIDNLSTDGTREFIPTHYPEVIFRPQTNNLRFGQGNNIGLRYAIDNNYDYVLLLNQDAYLQPDALELLLAQSDGESLMTPIHMCGDGTRIDHMFKNATLLKAQNTLLDDLLTSALSEKYVIGEFCAACWFLPLNIIKKVGGFNPLFFHYGEDNNYYQRLLYHGVKSYVVPKARVWHDRKVHGNMNLYNKNTVKRMLLINFASPIRHSFSYHAKQLLLLTYANITHPLTLLKSILETILLTRKIKNSNKTERFTGTTWL